MIRYDDAVEHTHLTCGPVIVRCKGETNIFKQISRVCLDEKERKEGQSCFLKSRVRAFSL